MLHQHRTRYPQGELSQEARLRRLQALTGLGRNQEALVELEQVSIENADSVYRGRELLVLRGELLAKERRCPEALALFDALQSSGAAVAERAMFGRLSCQLSLGNAGEADRSLRQYLERFPTGYRSEQARRLLKSQPLE